ncbi:hypothetical protein Pmani_007769 [Petrolisthes manimaculis]|uniref:Uncharacterized protein n=1 Tax=Petrolisthes manimaculis TaxID=1843537 RepID=A0AAE1Q6S2_9EUCA|nr:hypothetical protein Pmani_007769 [Petrolisthes manimaculis]
MYSCLFNFIVIQDEKGLVGRKVDDVLAALVGLSKNPTFWRFVHSVVAELDITQRTHPSQPPSTNHHAHGYWLRTAPGHLSKTSNNKESSWDTSHKERMDGFLTTTPVPSHLPWPHLISEDQYTPESKSWPSEIQNTTSSNDLQNDPLKTPTTTTQAPHFLFHRVIVDTGYDSHTRQPYRRPVLALTAVDIEKAKASGIQNVPMNNQNATSYSVQGSSSGRESQYEYDAVMMSQQVSSLPNNNKLEAVHNKQEGESIEYDEENELRSKLKKHHSHRSSHKVHRLYTFESQLRYLQRWEARLWRRSHFRPHKWSHSSCLNTDHYIELSVQNAIIKFSVNIFCYYTLDFCHRDQHVPHKYKTTAEEDDTQYPCHSDVNPVTWMPVRLEDHLCLECNTSTCTHEETSDKQLFQTMMDIRCCSLHMAAPLKC